MSQEQEAGGKMQEMVSIPAAAWQRLTELDRDMALARERFNLGLQMMMAAMGLEPGEWKLSPGERAFVRQVQDDVQPTDAMPDV